MTSRLLRSNLVASAMGPRSAAFVLGRSFSSGPPIAKVGVIGLGLMGHGIAQVAAEKGFEVMAIESESRFLDGGMAIAEKREGLLHSIL